MTTLHLALPTDLERELSSIRPDLETVVLEAIRAFLAARVFVTTEEDLEKATIQDNADEFLTPQELTYYLALQ